MLREFQELEDRDPKLSERVTKLIGHLLRHQFVHIDDRGSPTHFETLKRQGAHRLVNDFFEVAGYQVVVRDSEGWAGILPDLDRIAAPRMRVEETLVLLVLRRLWEEGVNDGDMLSRGTILLTLNEAHAAYEETVAQGRRPAMTAAAFRDIVHSLERRAIVSLGPLDREALDMELTVRPIVAAVTGDEFLNHLEKLLQQADASGEQAETEA